ncbi:2-dehydropantoate 2-reductase [Corynespora cassiicola Philippines]|uniref:2-dehydropantoate 2-reductase n=1 Tax=Corynespora cassiicola Philippines TaxID=1448308 RepID=A0A2T2NGU1_CORCC|nr:2-dehydropantoate 2-reductase [Corynespora cassiicola Philippines]
MKNVLIFGTGSVGTVHAMLLQKAEARVTCVCRSTYAAAKASGFTVHSTIFGTQSFRPNIVKTVKEAVSEQPPTAPFDFIVVCVKALETGDPGQSPPRIIEPAVRRGHTSIVIIQNGLGVERIYHDAFPDNPIISAVTYLPTAQTGPGTFSHSETQKLHIGPYPAAGAGGEKSLEKTRTFAGLITAAGGNAVVHGDIQIERWKKLIGNTTWNPICALSGCRDLEFLEASPELAQFFIINSMREVVAVAVALGYGEHVNEDAIKMQVDRSKARNWPGVEPSMLADMEAGRPMEVETVIGEVVRVAKRKGVDVPRLETLYLLLKAYNGKLRLKCDSD